jgi:murein DD-endopeptidase MepM/ murein hydrolase activator NlpD
LIAEVGATGRATGPHLDWRISWFDARVDAQLLAGPMPATTGDRGRETGDGGRN